MQEQAETARDAAKDFIRPYVLDGWKIEELTKKRPSTDRDEYAARIGGGQIIDYRSQEHTVTPQQIAVTRVGAADCWGLFDLAYLMAEIRDEQRGYEQHTLAAIFAQAEREEQPDQQHPAPRKQPAIYRAYMGGYCKHCGEPLGYIEADGGRSREFCDNNSKCRVAYHRAKKREQNRAATLQRHGELREYWQMKGIRGEVLLRLQEILLQHGKQAARAATDAVLVACAAQDQAGSNEQQRLINDVMLEGETIRFEEIQLEEFRIPQGVGGWSEFVSYASTGYLRQVLGYLYERQQREQQQAQARRRLTELGQDQEQPQRQQ